MAGLILILSTLPARAHYHELGYGEPYELAGKRIVFTTWYWVRPGEFDWVDDSGKTVLANRNVSASPMDPAIHWVERDFPRGVRLVAEPARKGELAIKPQYPWEADGIEITSLYQRDGKIMAWGKCKPGGNCYLESTDGGMSWTRPKLGLVEFNGSRENNLGGLGFFRGFYDENAPPEQRYKQAMNEEWTPEEFEKSYKHRRPWQRMAVEISAGKVQAVWGYTSPDGLVWTRTPEPLIVETSDGGQYLYYDPRLKKYVMYLRSAMIGPRSPRFGVLPEDQTERWHKFAIRVVIGRSESADFFQFPLSETVVEIGNDMAPDDMFQFNCYTSIPKAPDHHVMLPSRWIRAEDTTAIDLYTSHDGKLWHRAGTGLLTPSNIGQWDGGGVWVLNPGLVELANGDWVIPYQGSLLPGKYPRGQMAVRWGLAVWPKGRLMAIEAPGEGRFSTMAVVAPGSRLRINALTKRTGYIRVEAADLHGRPIPGRTLADSIPIIGDQPASQVRWKSADDLGVKPGEPIVLRFQMDRAKIYCLDFE
ncbi:hypothetical protein [Fontivita pretiosa]|uniref:hypothetical protein n=1 Tax=Fontivita pretiosa TaxID=2989684 RepID=UPI003D17A9DD